MSDGSLTLSYLTMKVEQSQMARSPQSHYGEACTRLRIQKLMSSEKAVAHFWGGTIKRAVAGSSRDNCILCSRRTHSNWTLHQARLEWFQSNYCLLEKDHLSIQTIREYGTLGMVPVPFGQQQASKRTQICQETDCRWKSPDQSILS